MKTRFAGAALLALALFGQEPATDPRKTVAALEAKCRSAKEYVFEGELTLEAQVGSKPGRLIAKGKVKLAVGEGGKQYLRLQPIDKAEYLLISDGQKSWAYVPSLKQYTEQEGVSLADEEDQEAAGTDERDLADTFSHQVMIILSSIYKEAAEIDRHGDEEVRIDGRKQKWPMLRVMSKKTARDGQNLTELTIDPDTLRLGRMVWANVGTKNNEKTVLRMRVDFTSFHVGENVAEPLFQFEPPKRTKLVESLPIPGQTGSALVNHQAPDFELKTLDGEKMRLSDLQGKVVLVNFWASWCPPCRKELPSLVKLSNEFKERGLVVLGVNDEGRGPAGKYAEKVGLSFATVDDSSKKAHRLYSIRSIPTVFIINREGKVVRFFNGGQPEATFRAALRSVGF
jgi:peroxiredoxin/outer membrane lipoprotein-sorting protein